MCQMFSNFMSMNILSVVWLAHFHQILFAPWEFSMLYLNKCLVIKCAIYFYVISANFRFGCCCCCCFALFTHDFLHSFTIESMFKVRNLKWVFFCSKFVILCTITISSRIGLGWRSIFFFCEKAVTESEREREEERIREKKISFSKNKIDTG